MIVDSLLASERYESLHPLFKQAFDYLKSLDFSNTKIGKTEIKNKELFVMVSDTTLKEAKDTKLEVHNKYIDIQLPISKSETFGWMERSNMKNEAAPFDTDKDIQFFTDRPESYVTVTPGNFIIFFPEDGHAPCIGDGIVRKIVVKIKL